MSGQTNATSAWQATQVATSAADPLGGATTFAKADKPTSVNVMLDWTPNTNHIGIYVAQALGYYKDANLTVAIQQPGDVQVEQIVATGKAQFGISYQEQATYSRAQNVPIVSVAAIIQHNTSGFAALHDKHPLKSPADLSGLRYGAFGSQVEKPILNILMQCAANKSADSIQFIDIGFTEPLPLMDKDRIDFVWLFYGWDGIRADLQGYKLAFVMLRDYTKCVPDYYTPLLITNEDMIKNQPDVVRAFVQATARGYAYAIQHPDEAADMLLKAAPDLDANLVKRSAVWLASQYQAEAPRWGEQRAEVWQGFTDFLVTNKALDKAIDVTAAFTNDFLPGNTK
ncbi:MAG: ABC transporter substrate-binding protein [Anaerolineae bacterium]|nr:ABC transporter substrate-binding protein [Anaerolineae bacterium]